MQGISTSKHQHLVDALLHLEESLSKDFRQYNDSQLACELRRELEAMIGLYGEQVSALAEPIASYNDLYQKARMKFLSPKLKELTKRATQDEQIQPLLMQNIRLVYGT